MKKVIMEASVFLLFIAQIGWANGIQYDVFLLAGQSNMEGRGKSADLTGDLAQYVAPIPAVLINLSSGGLYRPLYLSKELKPLQPAGMFGPELSFGHAMSRAMPGKHLFGMYQKSLTALISHLRADLALPKLPFLIGQLYNNGKRTNIFSDQKTVTQRIPNTHLVESTGLETWDNGTHFDAKSQIELGKRFAKVMLNHL